MTSTRVWITVIAISLALAVANSAMFFWGLFNQPPGTVYLGTVHYWEDYFFYLNHFFQGAHGGWLTVNRYTPEPTPPGIIYWCNVLLGKLGGLFFLSPILSYNISVLLLSFLSLLLSFLVAKKVFSRNPRLALLAFLMGNTATSLINRVKSNEGPMIWWPFQIWRTPHFAFDRLGGAPHQLIQTVLAYLFILSILTLADNKNNRNWLLVSLIAGILLTSVNPIQAVFYAGMLCVAQLIWFFKHREKSPRLLIPTIGIGMTSIYMNTVLSLPPHHQSKIWESGQHSYTTPGFLLLSLGPVAVLAIIGVATRIKKLSKAEIFGGLVLLVGYMLFFSRIPQAVGISNLRFLFPASYIFWGIFAATGVDWITGKASGKIRRDVGMFLIFGLYLLFTLPTLGWEITQKLPRPQDYRDPLVFIRTDVAAGFDFLEKRDDFDSIVLANPATHMDTLVPALSGHTTFSGHQLTTIDNGKKQAEAAKLFSLGLGMPEAKQWLTTNNITYILFTFFDGDKTAFEEQYRFLKTVFSDQQTTIYSL
jgi:hypothetical protein